jgi:hypothetical protein
VPRGDAWQQPVWPDREAPSRGPRPSARKELGDPRLVPKVPGWRPDREGSKPPAGPTGARGSTGNRRRSGCLWRTGAGSATASRGQRLQSQRLLRGRSRVTPFTCAIVILRGPAGPPHSRGAETAATQVEGTLSGCPLSSTTILLRAPLPLGSLLDHEISIRPSVVPQRASPTALPRGDAWIYPPPRLTGAQCDHRHRRGATMKG